MYKNLLLFFFCLFPLGTFAQSVDVVANPSSGTYQTPFYITLTPSDPTAKTFYSFKPDGYPQDAFLYEKPILLKQSSPFIYFSIVSTTNESKIKQHNYILEYSPDIHLESATVSGFSEVEAVLVNSGSEDVPMGFWHIQSELEDLQISEGMVLPPSSKQTFRLKYTGNSALVLRSPDSEEKDIIIPHGAIQVPPRTPPKKPIVQTSVVPRQVLSIEEIPEIVPTSPTSSETETQESILPPIEKIENPTSVPFDLGKVAKASVSESGEQGIHPVYLVLFLTLSLGAGVVQWYIRRRQK